VITFSFSSECCFPQKVLHGELVSCTLSVGRLLIRFKDVFAKRDLWQLKKSRPPRPSEKHILYLKSSDLPSFPR